MSSVVQCRLIDHALEIHNGSHTGSFKDILQIIPAHPNSIKLDLNAEKHDDKRAVCLLWASPKCSMPNFLPLSILT